MHVPSLILLMQTHCVLPFLLPSPLPKLIWVRCRRTFHSCPVLVLVTQKQVTVLRPIRFLLFRDLGDKVVNRPLTTSSLTWLLHSIKSLLYLLSSVKVKLVMSACGKSKASGAKQTTVTETNNLNKHNRVKNSSWRRTSWL